MPLQRCDAINRASLIGIDGIQSLLPIIPYFSGIEKVLTTHIAWHTFATMALSFGIPIEVVSKMIGHSSIKLTQLYAKVDRELIGRNSGDCDFRYKTSQRRLNDEYFRLKFF